MGKFAGSIFNTNHIHWVDSKPIVDMDIYKSVCESVKTFHGIGGNLIFSDIKVLFGLEQALCKDTGVRCKVIPILEQHILIDACRLTLSSGLDLDEIYRQVMMNYRASTLKQLASLNSIGMIVTDNQENEISFKIVLTVCVTGVGSAKCIKDILQNKLSYISNLKIISMSSLDDIAAAAALYGQELKLNIGTVNPHSPDVPFISADRVFTANGIFCISSILDDLSYTTFNINLDTDKTTKEGLDSLLLENFNLIAPNVDRDTSVSCISMMIKVLEIDHYKKSLPDDIRARLFMHAASMLERIANGLPLEMEDEHENVISQNKNWFMFLENTIRTSFYPMGYDIPRSEYFYFMLSLPDSI
jgi:transcriptional regulatory protein LevR